MAPKRRLMGKQEVQTRALAAPEVQTRALVPVSEAPTRPAPHAGSSPGAGARAGGGAGGGSDGAIMAQTKRGGGRGLKAVQSSREFAMEQSKIDGSKTESKSKVKEQKLYHATSNEHVETKLVTENKKRKTGKDGTITVTECTTIKKVCYM
mmetsp:Transcript_179238/g.568761  ORF Transcript_179238/g.568761 Transcript_179238/m.568761 type:complete len:151 (-) Transcript_179238:254-706(-)